MTLAALEATLRLYLDETRVLQEVPCLRMLASPLTELRQRTEALAGRLALIDGLASVKAREDQAYAGGGSLPDVPLKTCVVDIEARHVNDVALAQKLRVGRPAVMSRLKCGKVVLDVRTVFESQETELVEAVRRAIVGGGSAG